jgi:transcriptional regulator with XRE-family HTH domain
MKRNISAFGRRLKECRLEKKWGLRGLAMASGLSISYLSQVERGLKNVTYSNQVIIIGSMNLSFAYFFSGKEYLKVLPFSPKSSKSNTSEE